MPDASALPAPARPPKGWFHSIQTRLIVLFSLTFAVILVAVELIGFFGVPFTAYPGRRGYFRDEACRSLELIADLKEEHLRWALDERRRDLEVFARDPRRIADFQSLAANIGRLRAQGLAGAALWSAVCDVEEYRDLAHRLREIAVVYRVYDRLFLVDAANGLTIASSRADDLGRDNRGSDYFRLVGQSESGEYVSDVLPGEAGGQTEIYVSREVLSAGTDDASGRKPIAVLVSVVNAETVLAPILHTGGGLGAEGEAVLVNREGSVLTNLKHPLADGTEAVPLTHRISTEPVQRALAGDGGVVESIDYRGMPVLAASRYVEVAPGVGWGMIVKRDLDELYAPLRRAMTASLLLGLAGVAAVVALTIIVARSVTRPIRELSQTVQHVAGNSLLTESTVTTGDEVGLLAAAFNAMIARIRKSQEALLRHERLAAMGQLTATVSHELRNPLGVIRTSFYLLAKRIRKSGLDAEELLDRVDRSIVRCDAIIADLLMYSRTRPLELAATDVDSWLAELLGEQELPAGVALQQELASGAHVDLDRERFRRCLVNIVTNACQAMEPGGGTLTVAARREDGRLVLRVADTGSGIAPEGLARMFEPLYSTKSFGVGLGLCIVKQIVEQHGGDIGIESRLGQGTTVTLRLPIHTQAEVPHE